MADSICVSPLTNAADRKETDECRMLMLTCNVIVQRHSLVHSPLQSVRPCTEVIDWTIRPLLQGPGKYAQLVYELMIMMIKFILVKV